MDLVIFYEHPAIHCRKYKSINPDLWGLVVFIIAYLPKEEICMITVHNYHDKYHPVFDQYLSEKVAVKQCSLVTKIQAIQLSWLLQYHVKHQYHAINYHSNVRLSIISYFPEVIFVQGIYMITVISLSLSHTRILHPIFHNTAIMARK